jgi:hypothetical protein
MATTSLPDRYAEAVRARRAELRDLRDGLTGGHRAELRSALAVARLTLAEELATEVRRLGRQARAYLQRCGRRDRARFPGLLLAAADELRTWAAQRREQAVGAAVRQVAARRDVRLGRPWPAPGEHTAPPRLPTPDPGGPSWLPIAGGWRAALLPAASLPLVGLPVATPAVVAATAAVGIGAAVLVGGHQSSSTDRLRLRRWCDDVLVSVRADGDAALARLLIRAEQAAAELDAAVATRRREIEAELARLAPAPLALLRAEESA